MERDDHSGSKSSMSTKRRQCIVVLGMHRSGTSALTGVLQLLGVDLGKNLLEPLGDNNPRGFFENRKIHYINEAILKSVDSSWDALFPLPENWWQQEHLSGYKQEIFEILKSEFSSGDLFGIKDPRMCLLLPFWQQIFRELDITLSYVLIIRNPLEIAASLAQRNYFSLEKSGLLWMNYMLYAESYSRNYPRVFVFFDNLLDNPQKTIDFIASGLSLSFPHNVQDIKKTLNEFLTPDLKHYNFEDKTVNAQLLSFISKYYLILQNFTNAYDVPKKEFVKIDRLRNSYYHELSWFYNKDVQNIVKALKEKKCLLHKKEQEVQQKDHVIISQNACIEELIQREKNLEAEVQLKDLCIEKCQRFLKDLNGNIKRVQTRKAWKIMNMITRVYWEILHGGIKGKKRFLTWLTLLLLRQPLPKELALEQYTPIPPLQYDDTYIQIQEDEMRTREKASPYPKLTFDNTTEPIVSIIIPVYNQWHFTYQCLLSILENTPAIPYEVIVIDDASDDETKNIMEYVENIHVIRNAENLGYLKNCISAAKHVRGKYLLFLNNDTKVQPNWLKSLVEMMDKDQNIGIVGSKLICPDGRLQEAGGIIWNDGSGWNFGKYDDPEQPEYNYVREVDYISGAGLMIRKDLWNHIGGFDQRYVPAYYEDADLAFEARKRGYKVVYQPKSVVVHFEGVSCGTDINKGIKQYQEINKEKFVEKWKDILNKEHFRGDQNLFWARDRSKQKKCILVIDHCVPQYDKDAGSRSAFQYLKLFAEMGLNVKFMGDDFYKHEPYTSVLEQLGIEVFYGNWYANNWYLWMIDNSKYLDYVCLHRPYVGIKYIDFIKEYTTAKVLYQLVDLHFLRELRQYEIEKREKLLRSSERWKKIEFEIFRKADTVLTFSNVERTIIASDLSDKSLYVVPLFIFEAYPDTVNDFDTRKDIMYIGSFDHLPNRDAVLWFSDRIFPKVLGKIPDMKFIVVGSNPTEEIVNLQSSNSGNIVIKGDISDEELSRLYNQVKLVVIPLRYGAGVKGKLIEAMYSGVPVVATSIAIEGIEGIEEIIEPQDTEEAFAKEILDTYCNNKILKERSRKYKQYVKRYYSKERVMKIMKRILE